MLEEHAGNIRICRWQCFTCWFLSLAIKIVDDVMGLHTVLLCFYEWNATFSGALSHREISTGVMGMQRFNGNATSDSVSIFIHL